MIHDSLPSPFLVFISTSLDISADLSSCQMKLVHYYESFSDIQLYTYDKESDNKCFHDIYVPMVWKKVKDPDNIHKDAEINSPLELLNKVTKFILLTVK